MAKWERKYGRYLLNNTFTEKTFIHDIFEGTLTNETKCLSCETITSKDESFLDLSIDILAFTCNTRQARFLTTYLAHPKGVL
jgi:hypothetical protein